MSSRSRASPAGDPAPVFAALGDSTRLALVTQLSEGRPRSITQLTAGSRLTRQAVTKHLRMLEGAGLVRHERVGREQRFQLVPQRIDAARSYLDGLAAQWDEALQRLKAFVESEPR